MDVKGYPLTWNCTSIGHTSSHRSCGTFDEIKLGTFKQRVISAFWSLHKVDVNTLVGELMSYFKSLVHFCTKMSFKQYQSR